MELKEQQKIFKYQLEITGVQTIKMPRFAHPLKVMYQENKLQMWCQLTPSKKLIDYKVYIIGTGFSIPYVEMNYLDTVYGESGIVLHIFIGAD